MICDYVLTMGSYWHDYYINTVGYNEEKIRLIGDHDLDDLQLDTYHEKAICYIATVLVEDGSVKRSDFERFIKILAGSIDKKTKLYIKLHPRSDESLYKDLLDHNVEIIRNVPLPAVNLYIGHSSTLLGRALYESDQLIIWRFSKKIECFYEQFASAVCMDENQLKKALANTDISKHTNEKYEQISAVYWKNPRGALLSATELIYKYLKNERI